MRVVFVCVENSNRSQMAEAFARMAGANAESAGSRPSGKINPRAIKVMNELGYDLSGHRSKGLNELFQKRYDVAVTMGCGDECPNIIADRREDWDIPDPKEMSPEQFREVRDLIRGKVHQLLAIQSNESLFALPPLPTAKTIQRRAIRCRTSTTLLI